MAAAIGDVYSDIARFAHADAVGGVTRNAALRNSRLREHWHDVCQIERVHATVVLCARIGRHQAFNGKLACASLAPVCQLADRRQGSARKFAIERLVAPDSGAQYDGGVHALDLTNIVPMLAQPGVPERGIPSDPTNGISVCEAGDVAIDIAYGGRHRRCL